MWERMLQFLKDEQAAVGASEYILMAVILGIGMVTGLATWRDQVIQGYGDVALALGRLDQSFTYSFVVSGVTYSGGYSDTVGPSDVAGVAPAGIGFGAASPETAP